MSREAPMMPIMTGIATAVPPRRVAQQEALEHALRTMPGADARRLRTLYRRSGVEHRSIVLTTPEPAARPGDDALILEPGSRTPSTAERMAVYEREALPLAREAALKALAASGADALEITDIVTVSCTGFCAPGPDVALVRALGLSPHTARLSVGFMGCHGAINGLRAAIHAVRGRPDAAALLVCVELCSLHFTSMPTAGGMVANALFADGAAAAVIRGSGSAPAGRRGWRMIDSRSCIVPETESEMGWRIGDQGFVMDLTPDVPDHFAAELPNQVTAWLAEHGLSPGNVAWAIHPGGPRILDVVAKTLGLSAAQMTPSRRVLAEHGNMSSPTVLFILDRVDPEAQYAVVLAFGPGLTMEALLLRR